MKNWKSLVVITVLIFALDRVIKALAFTLPAEGLFYLDEFVGLKLFLNKGIAFGMPLLPIINITITTIITVVLISLVIGRRYNQHGLMLVIIGAISNLIDKVKYQAVIDFITIKYMPIFNLADLYILMGLIIIIWQYKKDSNNHYMWVNNNT